MGNELGLTRGASISPDELKIPKARAFAQYLESNAHAYARIVDVVALEESAMGSEAVIFEVEVERGQRPVHDIRRREQIAAFFTHDDNSAPMVWALRPDFPREVSHLYLYEAGLPPSLCVYEEPWDEVRLRWTPMRFVERIRSWLARTAAGVLHAEDQPLPPFMLGTYSPLVVPPIHLLAEADNTTPYFFNVRTVDGGLGRSVYIADPTPDQVGDEFLATVFRALPQEHRSLQWRPSTLAELHVITEQAGMDLLGELRNRLRRWHASADIGRIVDLRLMIVVVLPRLRTANGDESEPSDVWAFSTAAPIREVGVAIDVFQMQGKDVGLLITSDESKRGDDIELQPLRPHSPLYPALASLYSGIEPSNTPQVVAIGAGALGSQVFENLMRMGWGSWTLVDSDYALPHNFVRHALYGAALGRPKAEQLVARARETLPYFGQVDSMVADVLRPGDQAEQLATALQQAELVLDMSASVPVARHLTRDVTSAARQLSLFLNPCGSDLVLLAEDSSRLVTLDSLEMQYYRALISDPRLGGHLHREVGPIRYAQSCRDVSAVLGQDRVALHAAIGSRAVRDVAGSDVAHGIIWHALDDGRVERIDIQPHQTVEIERSPWRIVTDEGFLAKVAETRADRLPNETGGVLLGAFDLDRQIAYVVDIIPSPQDSVEWPTAYKRGVRGLPEQIEQIRNTTDRMLEYVGEWHSHPGVSCQPSDDDQRAFTWLSDAMDKEGLPALMLIVSENDQGWYLGEMV